MADEQKKAPRTMEIFRTEFPAIFRIDGTCYQEFFDIDQNESKFVEVSQAEADRWYSGGLQYNPQLGAGGGGGGGRPPVNLVVPR